MRYILGFWAVPMGLFWSWFLLASNDWNFGMLFFSRLLFDHVFDVYGQITGIAPDQLPMLIARACVVDTVLIFGIFAFRRRKQIAAWVSARRQAHPEEAAAPRA
ncbi:MAG: DUF6105 family protein [Roseitalea porphyridii]|uniref:DUF6105 family protein n=1 Tax=Roseitalea porphyridii TaxID=1852022 RepID=UPI0032EBA582